MRRKLSRAEDRRRGGGGRMSYVFRNLVRMPKNTLLIFAILFIVLFLEMFGGFIGAVCDECLDKVYGPLTGYYQVDTADVFSYDGTKYLTENVKNIEEFHSVYFITGTLFGGTPDENGEYQRLAHIESAAKKNDSGAFLIKGVTSCDVAEEVYSGKYSLTKGRWIERADDDVRALAVVISDVVAEKNGLDIGSAIRINTDKLTNSLVFVIYPYDLYVVGIYHCNEPDNSAYSAVPSAVNTNLVFMPLSVIENETVGKEYRSNVRSIEVFPQRTYLKLTPGTDPDELTDVLLSFGIRPFTISEFSGDAEGSPIVTMSRTVRYCSIAVLIAGAAMLVVITVLSIHSRKREISILCALGKSRSGVTAQFIGEFAVIFVLSVALAIALFSLLVGAVEPTLSSYLNVSQETSKIVNTTTLSYDPDSTVKTAVNAAPFAELFAKYVVSNTVIAVLTGGVELIAVAFMMWIYIKKTEVLTTLGGKV